MEFLETSNVISPTDSEVNSFQNSASKQGISVNTTKKEDSNKLPMTAPISPSSSKPATTLESSELECSLCFRLFCRPVTTSCGHTYCKYVSFFSYIRKKESFQLTFIVGVAC